MTSDPATWRVVLSQVAFDESERNAIEEVLASGWLSMGPRVEAFEHAFAKMHRVPHALAVNNGTAALHLAMLALGIGNGDEVIQPAINFVAGANVTRLCGATPRFVDIQSTTQPIIDPSRIEEAITPHTRAIMVMHYGGYAADIATICQIAEQNGLFVIEDACHAPATYHRDRALGTWGTVGCHSFFPNKNMTTAEGGMIVTDDEKLAGRIRSLRSHGMTTLTWQRHQGHASSYDVTEPGVNYRFDELRAALGLTQLNKLNEAQSRRRAITDTYRKYFSDVPDVNVVFAESHEAHAGHLLVITVPEDAREDITHACRQAGIQTSLHYPCITNFQAYAAWRESSSVPISQRFCRQAITLPLHPLLKEEDVQLVCKTVQEAMQNA